MTLEEQLTEFKRKYKPISTHTLLVGVSNSGGFLAAVYKKTEVNSKKYGKEIAECSVLVECAKTIEQLEKACFNYIEKI